MAKNWANVQVVLKVDLEAVQAKAGAGPDAVAADVRRQILEKMKRLPYRMMENPRILGYQVEIAKP